MPLRGKLASGGAGLELAIVVAQERTQALVDEHLRGKVPALGFSLAVLPGRYRPSGDPPSFLIRALSFAQSTRRELTSAITFLNAW